MLIGDVLIAQGLVTLEDVEEALKLQRTPGRHPRRASHRHG